jgi:hypothetical protein
MNRNEIANQVVNSNAMIDNDMLTNRERFMLVCSVFQCDAVALEDRYEFEKVIDSDDPMLIYASQQIASLQFEYFTRLHLEGLIDDERYEWWLSYLELSKGRLRWALSFVRFGQKVPPYPFLN